MMFFVIYRKLYTEKRLTSKTFGAEIHGFTGPEDTDENINVKDLLRYPNCFHNTNLSWHKHRDILFSFEDNTVAWKSELKSTTWS